MKMKKLSGKTATVDARGFSLIELLIVVAILGILSIAVGVHINTAKTKLKGFVFNTKTRFYQAKFEAVKRSRNVYVDFDFNAPAGLDNGFTIWMDENGDGSYVVADGDEIIGAPVVFENLATVGRHGPEIYCNACGISGGPGNDGPGLKTVGDGVTAGAPKNRFRFEPDGDSSDGLAYFYFPQGTAAAKAVKAGPWAIIVNTVGRVTIDEWKATAGIGWVVDNP